MKKTLMILSSIFIAICFLINIDLVANFKDLDLSFLYKTNIFGIFFVALFVYYAFKNFKGEKLNKLKIFLAILLALFMVIGECYVTYGSYKLIFVNIATFIISLIKLLGFTSLFLFSFKVLDKVLKKVKDKDLKVKNKYLKKFLYYFDKYPFRVSFVLIFFVILIYLIGFYPIVLSPDPSFQIKMFFNEHTKYADWVILRDPNVFLTAHHPVLQTFLLGNAIKLGRFLINDNFGLFIYTFFQSLIYASILAYTIKFLKDYKVKNNMRFLLLLIYMFVPMFALYSLSAVKDTLYTAFMILFTLQVFLIVDKYREEKLSYKFLLGFYAVMLLVSLFRHNGVYVIALTIIALLFFTKKNRFKILLTFLCFFASINAFDKVLVPSLGISDGSAREMLSVPFQQTARFVKEKPKFYKGEDKEIIDYILNYKTLASRYNPELADAVKNKYNKYTTTDDLVKYFKTWFKGLVKYPDIYVDATLNNTYGYFYPDAHNWYIYTSYDDRITQNDLVDYHFNNLEGYRTVLDAYANAFPYIPIIGLISNIGFNTWVVLIISVYLITIKKNKYLISLLPLYGSLVFCILGPANTYFRYTMPYVFVLPVLSMLLLKVVRGE